MGRAPCCDKNGMKKGPWTPEEDQKLVDYIQQHGHGSWRTLPKNAGLARCGKSCRLRWTNYLRPDIKRGMFSFEEEETIIQLHSILGNKWSAIAGRLPGRTDNEIKNYWNTHIRKRLLRMGIDPVTHSPRLDLLDLSSLLGHALCNPLQDDVSRLVLGIEPLVNPELLLMRIATDLFHESSAIHNILQQQEDPHDQQLPSSNINLLQNPEAAVPNYPWQDKYGSDHVVPAAALCYINNENVMMEELAPNFVQQQDDIDQAFGFQVAPTSCDWNYSSNRMHESVLSAPASSPATMNNSCSTHLNSRTEDDRDSYCSNFFQFQNIPDLLDAPDFFI